MSQGKYVDKILDRFGMTNCNPKNLPCSTGINKELSKDSKPYEDISKFTEVDENWRF